MSIAAAATRSTNSGSRSRRAPDGSLILDPGEFYILASKEAVQVPPDYAAEMVPFDPLVGEFRVHYAGFFDPGFGYAGAGGQGARAVLEVRSREVPFILEHGQIVGRLVYEKMLARPDAMYGQRIGSNYQAQGLKLSQAFSGVMLTFRHCEERKRRSNPRLGLRRHGLLRCARNDADACSRADRERRQGANMTAAQTRRKRNGCAGAASPISTMRFSPASCSPS